MWELKIAEGDGPHLYSTNNFVGRQFWEFNPDAGSVEEKLEVERARQNFKYNRRNGGFHACGDLLMRRQLIKENRINLTSITPIRLREGEQVSLEAVTTAVRKAVRLHRAIQANDGHWPAENAGPMFFTPPLVIALYISGTLNTILSEEHRKEMIRYFYNHQNDDGGWGFYIEGHSTMIGSALSYVALRLLGEGEDDGDGAITRARNWILDHGGANSIPSWGKVYLSVLGVYEWAGCNPLPPEFWLFPSAFPFHPVSLSNIGIRAKVIDQGKNDSRESPARIRKKIKQIPVSLKRSTQKTVVNRSLIGERQNTTKLEKLYKSKSIVKSKKVQLLRTYGYWGVCFIYGTFFALRGLSSTGKTYDNSEAVRKGVKFLLSIQNEEGGWGESLLSCPTEVYTPLDGNRTNLVQTSWAMLGLMYGGQVERDLIPLHKAAKLLINAQMDNGDFPQQEITGVYMKNCLLLYAQYRNIFPLWALGEYRNRVWQCHKSNRDKS
ncbi:squalene cyclase [Artemisia annua]|uniref:Squalene cyclase n=1 Tax=Artemisia annua TaxID=35608 RepID=A0A2U1M2F2_ARTAN|nr:squalene cyclase [Artemisia annua]